MIARPSEGRLNVLRWVVTAALAVVYMLTGFEPALLLGIAILLLPAVLHVGKRRP